MRYLALLLLLFVVSPLAGSDILVISDAGFFVIRVVDGVPQPSQSIETWWQGDVVDQRVDVPQDDAIADQVDEWGDLEDQELRPIFAAEWMKLVAITRGGQMTPEQARVEGIAAMHKSILDQFQDGRWVPFCEKITELTRSLKQEGEWDKRGLAIIESIQKGLARDG